MRYAVLSLLCAAAMIAYVQRNAISVPTKAIQAELGFDEAAMGVVLGAWYWGYALLQLPAGWLTDRWGSRTALALFALLWSVLTGVTGLAFDLNSLLLAWFAMGLAQAGVFPGATKAIGAWFPASGRASASGWLICGQLAGAAVAPVLVAYLLTVLTWQQTFVVVAVPGVVWAVAFYALTPRRDEPTPEPLALGAVLGRMATSVPMLLLCGQQFLRSAAMTFFFTWFPRYLQEVHGTTQTQSGWLAAMPPVAAMGGGMLGGLASDWLLRTTGNRRLSRQGVAVAGMTGCTALTLAAYFVADPLWSVVLISAGAFWGVFGGVSGYSVAIEFGGKRVATVFATMNMCGNVGSALFPMAVGYLVRETGRWDLMLLVFAALFAADAVLWALMNPKKPLFEDGYDARYTPQSRVRAGFARGDITPPVGIYHRMWGAATHDRATGVHRPLLATALWLEPPDGGDAQVVIGLDHCLLEAGEIDNIRAAVSTATGVAPGAVQVALSHTHGAGWMARSRAHLPGGEHVGPYLDRVAAVSAEVAAKARELSMPATIVYGTAKCSLAAHRDMWDAVSKQYVCGFNPGGPPADDTVLVVKAVADGGATLGTVVNYACHPTTLAWENTLVSPDYVGALREVVEAHTGAPCLFLQGASGEIGPREGYVGDVAVADRNGRQLGFAALSGLESLPPPGTRFEYAGPVVSGAVLGTWTHQPLSMGEQSANAAWDCRRLTVPVPYRVDLPTLTETRAKLTEYTAQEAAATDPVRKRDSHALVEQMNRQVMRLTAIPEGKAFPLPVELWRLGGAVWVFTPGELYQSFQTTLRKRFPNHAVVVTTITNGWQPGYLPAASSYGYGIYQEIIAAVGPGGLEALTEVVARSILEMTGSGR